MNLTTMLILAVDIGLAHVKSAAYHGLTPSLAPRITSYFIYRTLYSLNL
ncbi:hypothetical protein PCARR_a0275 [Pseudoalteromonas carrageenovora IAM 12662]|uniref:Uncharacterized protein n=1 Tax=Pseudoalteromonas carrageenovora IAM 12662 TaxID=1314868 RepID=A0ABR9ENA0_PSEVC|nr:hypothetical protein [Pseudoalteromonas carrageenovora IAM 12662]